MSNTERYSIFRTRTTYLSMSGDKHTEVCLRRENLTKGLARAAIKNLRERGGWRYEYTLTKEGTKRHKALLEKS